jgi:UDP-3-O-[3-hydroxymyristoyl] glucosamine N-acyltransferase
VYNIKNPERLDFIRKTIKERGIDEVFSLEDAKKRKIVEIGNNVKIKDGTVIGTDGWGYERNESDELEKFPHYGKVIIGNNVDISANCTIDRGNMNDTIIGNGTKIDSGVHVAHNVKIGNHSRIGAHSILLGHCEIGDFVDIWTNVVIKEGVKIGNNAVIGSCSFVDVDVPSNSHFISEHKKIIHDFKNK